MYCTFCSLEMEFQELLGNSHAVLLGNSHAELQGSSHAVLWDNSHAVLWDNSHAELRDSSHAVLWGNSHAVLRGSSHAECRSPYACGILKSNKAKCTGRHIGDMPISPREYMASCGVPILDDGSVILYKSVRENGCSFKTSAVKYEIGKQTVAPDWDVNANIECGKGLHLSPTPQQADSFNYGVLLACSVKLDDIAPLPAFAQYPDKIRVRATVPLYKVDINGKRIDLTKNRDAKGRFCKP